VPKKAEDSVKESLDQAQEDGAGLAATVTQGVPPIKVKVLPGQQVGHDGVMYEEGGEVELDGPSAIALIQLGYVTPA
jgi:hypothetical protein